MSLSQAAVFTYIYPRFYSLHQIIYGGLPEGSHSFCFSCFVTHYSNNTVNEEEEINDTILVEPFSDNTTQTENAHVCDASCQTAFLFKTPDVS